MTSAEPATQAASAASAGSFGDAKARLAELEAVFAALAHAARRHVLLVVWFRGGTMSAGDIAGRFSHTWPTTSRHLRVLEQAGLLAHERQGRTRIYRVNQRKLDAVRAWLRWFDAPKESESTMPKTDNIQHNGKILRDIAMTYPGAHEDFPWGETAIKVGGKAFLFMHMGAEQLSLSCKLPASHEMALMLPFAKPTGYGLGKSGWVSAAFGPNDEPPIDLLREWLDESYRAIAPKKLARELEREKPASAGAGRTTAGKSEVKKTALKKTPAAKQTAATKTASKAAVSRTPAAKKTASKAVVKKTPAAKKTGGAKKKAAKKSGGPKKKAAKKSGGAEKTGGARKTARKPNPVRVVQKGR